MKRIFVLPLLLCCMTAFSQRIDPVVCPYPAECSVDASNYVPLDEVSVSCPDASASEWVRRHAGEWYGNCAPKISKSDAVPVSGAESYSLIVADGKACISAQDLAGVRYAMYTLRQLTIPKRGTETVEGWIVPVTKITDSPRMKFRGIHICWFAETEAWEVERLIRLAAYYKMNYAVIESWGTFRSEKYPWLGWPDGGMTKSEISRLRAIADDMGITLIPQMNLFGHATSSRTSSGNHATLDFNPEYQPLFEPSAGWNWCLTNPKTREILVSFIGEMMDAFGNPPYFHMGCDEADPPSCPDCTARPYSEIFLEHIAAMTDAIRKRGARPMMWHDMFLERGDGRWEGLVHNGTLQTTAALENLPKDIVMCDWYYGAPRKTYPSLEHFKSKGFHVLTSPWDNIPGIREQGRQADSLAIDGMLCTLWHHYFGSAFAQIYPNAANAAWNGSRKYSAGNRNMFYNHLRQIGWDMHVKERYRTGIYERQIQDTPVAPY